MALSSTNCYPMTVVKFDNWNSVQDGLTKTEGATQAIEVREKNFRIIDVKDIIKNLGQVGRLLPLAYAGSQGFQCSNDILATMSNFQALISKTDVTTSAFLTASLHSLKFHYWALRSTENKKWEVALSHISKCAENAIIMAKKSHELAQEVGNLCKVSQKALLSACNDKNIEIEQKRRVEETISKLQAQEESLKARTAALKEAINEEQQSEDAALSDAKQARNRALFVSIISAVTQPVTSIVKLFAGEDKKLKGITDALNQVIEAKKQSESDLEKTQTELASKQAKAKTASDPEKGQLEVEIAELQAKITSKQTMTQKQEAELRGLSDQLKDHAQLAEARAAEAATQRRKLRGEQITALGDLAESVNRLNTLNSDKNELSKAITSLEIVVQTLGKIKTTFEDTYVFWMGVRNQCKQLNNVKDMKDLLDGSLEEEFVEELKQSGLNCFALSSMIHKADIGMQEVKRISDHGMSNLPVGNEAARLVTDLSTSLGIQFKQEKEALEQANAAEI